MFVLRVILVLFFIFLDSGVWLLVSPLALGFTVQGSPSSPDFA